MRKTTIILSSILLAFIIMSSGYGLWQKQLTIQGDIDVIPDPKVISSLESQIDNNNRQIEEKYRQIEDLIERQRISEEQKAIEAQKLLEAQLKAQSAQNQGNQQEGNTEVSDDNNVPVPGSSDENETTDSDSSNEDESNDDNTADDLGVDETDKPEEINND